MIFSAISDLHITDKCPKNRKDSSYYKTCLRKFDWIVNEANSVGEFLLIAGDVFDYPSLPRYVVTDLLRILKQYDHPIYVVPGQHDLRYHTKGTDNTSLGNMIAAGAMKLLSPDKETIVNGLSIVGKGWEEKVTALGDILITHEMVTKKGPLWPGQSDFISAPGILHSNKSFQCIISGDNHIPHDFIETKTGRIQINCGSVMRSKKDQINHTPFIWHIDTDLNPWEHWNNFIPIEKAEEVFDFTKIKEEEKKEQDREAVKAKINEFITASGLTDKKKVDFRSVLETLVKEMDPSDSVKNIIETIMEKVA